MSALTIPHINNNDTHAILVEWCVEDGESVSMGTVVAVLETSKSTFDLEATEDGELHIEKEAGEEYPFGERIGSIGDVGDVTVKTASEAGESSEDFGRDFIITRSAREIIEKHGLDEAALRSLGKRIIRKRDLTALLHPEARAQEPSVEITGQSQQQSAIAKVVTRSHREIPAAFLVKKVFCDQALEWLAQESEKEKKLLSLTDLLVQILGRLAPSFPLFFANTSSDGGLKQGLGADVGVTFDFGKGLYVPVIRGVDALSLTEVAARLMRFRMKAMRGRFDQAELIGGALSLSLNMDADTVFVRPLILPPQVCMVSLGSIMEEPSLDANDVWTVKRVMHMGIAYDHRFINGFESQQFAARIKEGIETAGEAPKA